MGEEGGDGGGEGGEGGGGAGPSKEGVATIGERRRKVAEKRLLSHLLSHLLAKLLPYAFLQCLP